MDATPPRKPHGNGHGTPEKQRSPNDEATNQPNDVIDITVDCEYTDCGGVMCGAMFRARVSIASVPSYVERPVCHQQVLIRF